MKKTTFLKIGTLFFALVFLLLLGSCASKRTLTQVEPVKKGKTGEEFVIERSDKKMPKWVYDPEFEVTKEKGEKFVVVLSDVQHTERRAAERIAEGDLRKRVAEGIKTLVDSQFREALSGTAVTYDQSFESYVQTVANDIPVVGLIVTDTYWEKVQRFKTKKQAEYFYRVVKRAKMPYTNYTNARNAAWQDVLAATQNERERQELEILIENMKSGDEI
jgi:hypothetical protein